MTTKRLKPEDAVAAGAAVLSVRVPDWRERIDVDDPKFTVGSWTHCLLGCLYGSYWKGVQRLRRSGERFRWSAEHGFCIASSEHGYATRASQERYLKRLDALWREEVKRGTHAAG